MKKIILCALVILLLGACQTKRNYQSDIKAFRTDITSIRTWMGNYEEAIKSADIEQVLSYYSDDVSYLPPNQPSFSGKENLRKWFLAYYNYFSPSERLDLIDFEVFGDFAYLQGKYSVTGKMKQSGEEFRDNGKFINFFKRQPNGNWTCTQSIWNSNNRIYDIHSQIPADFSGTWKLDTTNSTPLPNIISSTLVITQIGNDITLNRTYEIKDKEPLKSFFKYTIGSETKSTTKTGSFTTTSSWDANKQTLTILETLFSEKKGTKQKYTRTTVYSLTAKGEVLNVISDDILPEGLLTSTNKKRIEMIYTKF